MSELNKLHANVQASIARFGIQCQVHYHAELPVEIRSPQDFADALGYPVQRITKTLFVHSREARTFAVAVCSADRRMDFKAMADAMGVRRVEAAALGDLEARTGYPPGGVSPLGLAAEIVVVMDSLLLDYPTVLVGGGTAAVEVEISPSDLVKSSKAIVGIITK